MSNILSILSSLQETVNRMDEKLSSISTDVEMIKKNPQSQQVAQPSGETFVTWHTVLTSVTPSEVPHDNDTVITRLMWADRMELEDKADNKLETTEEQPKDSKIFLTKVLQPTDFMHEAFTPINNASRR